MNNLDKAEIILAGGCSECFQLDSHKTECSKSTIYGWANTMLGMTRGGATKGQLKFIHCGRGTGKSMLSQQIVQQAIREGKTVGFINYE